ncbi:efflux RND transporter periplasmic adaptor subunit [Microbulbifer thermotolerans]|uniref:efflux RND transporter periplasmic adaptor subunit n=1 Tax=Microbulbifer thermotolerans TaxID=252514 RepID=UPI0022491EE3|nr:efflux RND transporter periplasmic adaptor subunit [Microbulbifer thermotolerans]MCX2832532.1 efflux RND transporter periplasmic adaptor subunit [Microbulbifer thermotolerans]
MSRVLNKRMLLMLLGCLLLFGGIFAFKYIGLVMMNRAFDSMPLPPATVTSFTAEVQVWQETLTAVGTLRAVNGVEVTTEAQGIVSAIHFKSGQSVEKGALLAELAAEPEIAQLQVLEAELRLARRNHQRVKALHARGVTTEADLDATRSELEQVLANLEVQRATIDKRQITAPFSGVLGIRRIDLGQNVNPGEAVVSLQQLDPIYVDFFLPERHLATVALDLPITLGTDAFPGKKFHGRITAIDPSVDAASRNFLLQGTLKNPQHRLRPGMFADVAVQIDARRKVLVVPRTALMFAPYGTAVFILRKSDTGDSIIARKRFVKTGEERGDLVEVVQGLRAGEVVASSGLLKLRNEGAVIIENENRPPADADPKPENS